MTLEDKITLRTADHRAPHRPCAWPRLALIGVTLGAFGFCGCIPSVPANTIQTDTTTDAGTKQAPALLSAFFGLDHALPRMANFICSGAQGQTGMPVVFPLELDLDSLQAGDFAVRTKSGQKKQVFCVSPAPATDPGELRTMLLIGDIGSKQDPPVQVEIVGNLLDKSKLQNFKGRSIDVIPLEAGPTMILAEVAPKSEWSRKSSRGATSCPDDSKQVVRITWTGGVTRQDKADVGDTERLAYRVRVAGEGGVEREVVPFALADLNDGDNNHDLCLDTDDRALSVSFPAGRLTDPANDLNPETSVDVKRP